MKALLRALSDPTATTAWGGSHTCVRTMLVSLHHEAYHLGLIVLVQALCGEWVRRPMDVAPSAASFRRRTMGPFRRGAGP